MPEGLSVHGGSDDVRTIEDREDGSSTVYVKGAGREPSVADFAETPSGAEATGQYAFGPVEIRVPGEGWAALSGTSDTNPFVGPEQPRASPSALVVPVGTEQS